MVVLLLAGLPACCICSLAFFMFVLLVHADIVTFLALPGKTNWLWVKNRYPNGTLVSGNMDQTCGPCPDGLSVTHSQLASSTPRRLP